jgi:hypothetical protein
LVVERISVKGGVLLLPLLVAGGLVSVVYWYQGELRGAGDLRFYALVQFYPLLGVPLMMALFPPRYTRGADLFGSLEWYGAAKCFERLDANIFALGHLISGHTLKHLAAGLGCYWILRMLRARQPID